MTNPAETDALILRLATGDKAALDALWQLHGRGIRALGTRFLGTAEGGDEILQETFLRVWQKADSFAPERGSGKVWLYTIARNTARDQLRRQRLRWLVGLDALPTEPEAPIAGPEATADARARLARVQTEILDLPDTQRMALLLATIADLDTPAIAAIMGRSRGAVEQLIVRARKRLRMKIEDDTDG